MSPLAQLRRLVLAWRLAQIDRERARWSGEGDDEALAARETHARSRLGTGEARALLETCTALGLLDPIDARVFVEHLADAAREEVASRLALGRIPSQRDVIPIDGEAVPLGALLRDVARDLSRLGELEPALRAWLEPRARRFAEVHREADAIAARTLARAPREEGAEGEAQGSLDAEAWLRASDDAVREAMARARHALSAVQPLSQRPSELASDPASERAALFGVLRAAPLDTLLPARDRLQRLALALGPIGLDERARDRLSAHTHDEPRLEAKVLLVRPPARVAIALSPIEAGLASSLAALEGLARAHASASVSPALGDEHRYAPSSELPPLLGSLAALFATSPAFLRRSLGLEVAEARTARALFDALVIVRARLDVARSVARRDALQGEARDALAARALGLDRAPGLGAALASFDATPELERRARSATMAPSAYVALRERFDEDFYRNPRTAAVLVGASARGARLSSRRWLAELGVSADASELARLAGALYEELLAARDA